VTCRRRIGGKRSSRQADRDQDHRQFNIYCHVNRLLSRRVVNDAKHPHPSRSDDAFRSSDHLLSGPRTPGPFLDVNCAAIPEALLQAELFGYEAGAFTDARRAKLGLFEAASTSILFLDEIDVLPLPLQGKLLTAVEEKQVRRVGAVAAHSVDVKLFAATQEELSSHDATAASPATCIAERYVSAGGKTWHIWGNFGEFLGYFGEALVL
jgi:hypothetical protein